MAVTKSNINTKKKKGKEDANYIALVDWENHSSPYYSEEHHEFREKCRLFVDKEILPKIDKWEKQGGLPKEFYKKMYSAGLYSFLYEPEYGGTPVSSSLQHDPFLLLIWYEQICRAGSGGLITSSFVHGIALPPVLTFGTKEQKELIKPVIKAEKFAALAISETTAGSDVRNIKTVGKLDPNDNDYWIVNGEKYWITGGMKADYFITAVRTGDSKTMGSIDGISMMIIPRCKGVITSRLDLMGHAVSDTAYVVFKNVRVHKSMIIGAVNQGFMIIMYNFNTERMGICMSALGMARTCVEEAARYAKSRKTFGKPLIKWQVIRHKLAEMSRQVLATHALCEKICYQMRSDPFGRKEKSLPRNVSLLKVQCTKTLEYCAREAAQIFGGRSYVKGGRAGKIERIYRDVRAFAIYGGSEEIMLDLAIRQAKL